MDQANIFRQDNSDSGLLSGLQCPAMGEPVDWLRALVSSSDDAVIGETLEGAITTWNAGARRMYGYGAQEIVGQSMTCLVPPEHASDVADILARMRRGERIEHYETQHLTKAGRRIDVSLSVSPILHEGQIIGVSSIARDISERKKDEQRIAEYQDQLRVLASELVLAEERERRKLASDLHDGPGQVLALVRMRLGALRQSMLRQGADEGLVGVAEQIEQLMSQAIEGLRSLMVQISPPVLDHLGLLAAVKWLAQDVEQRYGLSVGVIDDGRDKALDARLETILFRAVRELLINVAKHARTDQATVRLTHEEGRLRIEVEDRGCGFDYEQGAWRAQASGFGLLSIRERLALLGGEIQVRSVPGEGTTAELVAPLAQAAAAAPVEGAGGGGADSRLGGSRGSERQANQGAVRASADSARPFDDEGGITGIC